MNITKVHKLHGILFMALFAFAAFYLAEFEFFKALSLSPLIIGIIMGMIYANTLRMHLPEEWVPGIKFCGKTILRLSIIFYGFRLTMSQVAAVGMDAIWVDVIMVVSVIGIGLIAGKLLGIDKEITLLTSSGSAICGAAAVLGTEPVVGGKPYKTVVAVSTVVIFGTIAMFMYPMLYRAGVYGMTPKELGVYTGATVHEVAHVVGAGNAMTPEIADIATITKMIRVILLAPFLLILSFFLGRNKHQGEDRGQGNKVTIPWFAIWFLIVIVINTLLSMGATSVNMAQEYGAITKLINNIDTFGLTMAMTAIGADASFAKFKEAGIKPFLLALILFAWLTIGGYFIVKLIV
nr:YeiH family protein [Porphyromonas pogonae]